jgi:protein involved in ribonucleotide reduction
MNKCYKYHKSIKIIKMQVDYINQKLIKYNEKFIILLYTKISDNNAESAKVPRMLAAFPR